jgi:hypothetical protein
MTDSQADAATPPPGGESPGAGEEPPAGAERSPVDRAGEPSEPAGGAQPPRYAPPSQEAFGWRGWLLVGIVVLSFLVVPATILFLPQAEPAVRSLGLTLRAAYLALPMIPALLLGATAVWAAVRSRSAE